LIDLGLSEESEGLLELSTKDSVPAVYRYDIKSIIIGSISLIGSAYAGFWGAVIALAGLWEIWGFRESLPPSACAIVWLLSEARGSELEAEELEIGFGSFRSLFFNSPELAGEFGASMIDLEKQGIVQRRGTRVLLQERYFFNPF
jgi:hypothetical protein